MGVLSTPNTIKKMKTLSQKTVKSTLYIIIFFSYLAQAQQGSTLQFNGNQYGIAPNNASLNLTKFTLEGWIFWNSSGNTIQFITSKGMEKIELHTGGGANNLRFIPAPGVYLDGGTNVIPSNTWFHLACAYDPSQSLAKMYINGNEITLTKSGTAPLTTAINADADDLRIGVRSDGSFRFIGRIDELRLWNRVLTLEEIKSKMNCEIQEPAHGLQLNYHFNQGIASGTNTGINTIIDDSGFGNNAPMTGFGLIGGNANWVAPGAIANGTQCDVIGRTLGCGLSVLTATGGVSYAWSGGESPSQATNTFTTSGMYTVSITYMNSTVLGIFPQSISINNPSAPSVVALQTFCGVKSVNSLYVISGTGIKWYSTSIGGQALANNSTFIGANTFYATQTVNLCESPRIESPAIAYSHPSPPTVTGVQSICGPATVAMLTATGQNITWYNSPSNIASILPSSVANTGLYYATQKVNGCESTIRAVVTFTASVTPMISIAASPFRIVPIGDAVTLTSSIESGGPSPSLAWLVNGSVAGTAANYIISSVVGISNIELRMIANNACQTINTITSNSIQVRPSRRFYVKGTASGAADGSSWANARADLNAVIQESGMGDEIWVAAGTYYPTTTTNRNISFVLREGVKMYGSFAGTESSLAERTSEVMAKNQSVLSGDIGTKNTHSDNSYHVVVSENLSSASVLDGFSIIFGYAKDAVIVDFFASKYKGGGIYSTNSSTMYHNLIIALNLASREGGGIYLSSSNSTITNCVFSQNTSENSSGGGAHSYLGSITFYHTVFYKNNTSSGGAGVDVNFSLGEFYNCTFVNNNTNNNDPGGNAIGFFNTNGGRVVNSVFQGNTAYDELIYTEIDAQYANIYPDVVNCILQKEASNYYNVNIFNSLFETNPNFRNSAIPTGADNLWFTSDDGFQVNCNSPAYNAGVNTLSGANIPQMDILGRNIFAGIKDIGAYESQINLTVNPNITVLGNTIACGAAVLTANIGSLGNFSWKTTSSTLTGASISLTSTGIYSISGVNEAACSAIPFVVTVTVNSVPGMPEAASTQGFCTSVTSVATLSATGINLKWYVSSIGGVMLNTATPISTTGIFYVSQSSAFCESDRKPVNVNFWKNTEIIVPLSNATVCSGVTQTLVVSATGTNIAYLWNTGLTTNAISTSLPGNYTVSIVGTCGAEVRSAQLYTIPTTELEADLPSSITLTGANIEVILTAAGDNLSYAWSNGSNNANTTIASTGFYTATISGTCGTVITSPIEVFTVSAGLNTLLGINDAYNSNKIKIYPNPSNGILNIETTENILLELYNAQGIMVFQTTIKAPVSQVHLNVATGLYSIKIGKYHSKLLLE